MLVAPSLMSEHAVIPAASMDSPSSRSDPAARSRRRWQLAAPVILVAAVAAALAVASQFTGREGTGLRPGAPVPDASAVARLFAGVPERGPRLGRPTAPMTLVLYADPQCPFCAAFERTQLPRLVAQQVRPGHLQIVLRPLTFLGADSDRAARMLVAAGERDRLWPLADLMARHQGAEGSGWVTDRYLLQVAGAVSGLGARATLARSRAPAVATVLRGVKDDAARDGVRSTPWLEIGRTGGVLRHLKTDGQPDAGDVADALGRG